MIGKFHRKLPAETKCICGAEVIFFDGRWHCVEYLQQQLADTEYAIFKKI